MILIAGAGAIGAGIAYQLALRGARDVVLCDRGAVAGGSTGAALGGFLIAFIEVFSSQLGYSRWSEAIVFSILVLVLVFRPTGILGQQLAERA